MRERSAMTGTSTTPMHVPEAANEQITTAIRRRRFVATSSLILSSSATTAIRGAMMVAPTYAFWSPVLRRDAEMPSSIWVKPAMMGI